MTQDGFTPNTSVCVPCDMRRFSAFAWNISIRSRNVQGPLQTIMSTCIVNKGNVNKSHLYKVVRVRHSITSSYKLFV